MKYILISWLSEPRAYQVSERLFFILLYVCLFVCLFFFLTCFFFYTMSRVVVIIIISINPHTHHLCHQYYFNSVDIINEENYF